MSGIRKDAAKARAAAACAATMKADIVQTDGRLEAAEKMPRWRYHFVCPHGRFSIKKEQKMYGI